MRLLLSLSGEDIAELPPLDIAGVGLVRGEYLVRKAGCYVTRATCRESIAAYLTRLCALLAPSPVWYRLIEMETSELNLLDGVDHQIVEKTTMLGLRGIRRSLAYPETFAIEAQLLADLARRFENLHVVLPFVTQGGEAVAATRILRDCGFANQIGIMAEIPAALEAIDDFIDVGIRHFTVGMNDLGSLFHGAARGLEVSPTRAPALRAFIGRAVAKARAAGATTTIAGYFDRDTYDWAADVGFDAAAVSYSMLPAIFAIAPSRLPAAEDLFAIKRGIRAAVAAQSSGAEHA